MNNLCTGKWCWSCYHPFTAKEVNMSTKRLISLVFLTLLLTACKVAPLPAKEPQTFTVLYNQREVNPLQEDWLILDEYKKRQNVELDVKIGNDEDYGTAVAQTFESGNLPDIILKVWPSDIESYAVKGLLLPFSDYEDLMPYFTGIHRRP